MTDFLKGRKAISRDPDYAILASEHKEHAGMYYRVLNLKTGDESQLCSYSQCEEIIRLAKTGDVLKGRTPVFTQDAYAIVPSDLPEHANTHYRVVNLQTGNESALYSINECREIIRLGKAMGKGSFEAAPVAPKLTAYLHGKSRSTSAIGGFDSYWTKSVPVKETVETPRSGITRTGYGARMPTPYMIKWNGRWHRVYCIQYSNSGTLYIGRKYDQCLTVQIDR